MGVMQSMEPMGFKRPLVRLQSLGPYCTNPNLVMIGEGFGFVFLFDYPNFNAKINKPVI